MPYLTTGSYFQVSGAITAAAGQVIQSAVWNNIHGDMGTALSALGACQVALESPRNIMGDNGSLEIWQRAAGGSASIAVVASATSYTADRWYLMTGANQACTVAQKTSIGSSSSYCGQIQRNSGQTGTGTLIFAYPLDTDEVVRMRGKKVSLAFMAATGADWSPANGTLVATLYVGTGTVQKAGAAAANFTGPTTVVQIISNIAANTASALYGAISNAAVPATATQAEVQFTWTPTGTAGTNDWFQLDDVMLDGSVAPGQGFIAQYEGMPFGHLIRECKRHFWKSFAYGKVPANGVGAGSGELMCIAGKAGTNPEFIPWRHPVSMRAVPSVTLYNPVSANSQVYDLTDTADCSSSSATGLTRDAGYITTTGAVGTAVGNLIGVHITADSGI